ncbi:Protein BTN1 [Candida viswanathii]|uniref:Protein BTN n=1 Tax=Candida viswanathii TaxID=5486 RepID=A0A367XQK3_9ASCO|nr:Protein BTN1 [Candida viswanathii]
MFIISESQRTFTSFFIFGLLNNILYVIILSAAIDLVGPSTPKAIVLLSDVLPSFLIKLFAPFFIHRIPYLSRIYCLIGFSSFGMLLLSLSPNDVIFWKILGIALASLSSGMGEVSFLQLTHYFNEVDSIGGFSSGTGGAGLFGSFFFMIMTNLLGIPVWIVLLLCSVLPVGFVVTYFKLLPLPTHEYEMVDQEDEAVALDETVLEVKTPIEFVRHTMLEIKPLVLPYMVPLTTVYISEYVINQGISPTLLFPLDDLPHWLFSSYRDIYVVYGFLYQLGVFISRSSISFGIRIKHLYLLSVLQFINVLITLCQSIYDSPFSKIWLLLVLIFYEGLLGGASYVNTYKSVSEEVPRSKREFSMGSVSISDSLGIVLAGCINWWLEVRLCNLQVSRGRDWCMKGGSI